MREASRAFTGWTIAYTPPRGYYNRWDWEFEYREEDHDDGEKTVFLGHTGNFDGEDIIDIIVQQPACHRFIARHLYNFFVADEPQVPAWQTTRRGTLRPSNHRHRLPGIAVRSRSTLRVIFNSDFFKNARFARISSPAEAVVSLLRLAGGYEFPAPGIGQLAKHPTYMGQELLNLPASKGGTWGKSGSTAGP